MFNPFRGWAKLVIRATPKSNWKADLDFVTKVAVARITGTLITLVVLLVYLTLDRLLPELKHLWGISFIFITMMLWGTVFWRFNRLARYFAKKYKE